VFACCCKCMQLTETNRAVSALVDSEYSIMFQVLLCVNWFMHEKVL